MKLFAGKQKAWMAGFMPFVVGAAVAGLNAAGVTVNPNLVTGLTMVLSAFGVYQVANKV